MRQKLVAVTDRMAGFEGDLLNVHVDFPLSQRLALPIQLGRSRIPGVEIQDTRMMRQMEVLLHGASQLVGWRTAQVHEAIRAAFHLSAETYTLTQLRYDLPKMTYQEADAATQQLVDLIAAYAHCSLPHHHRTEIRRGELIAS